jgi:3-phenylpropionate/cinnamic acid dioxygenase small subunit
MTTEVDTTTRQELFDLVVRYATGIDRRDWDLFRTCWTDDAVTDYGVVGHWDSGDAITKFMFDVHADCGHTAHRVGNYEVHAEGDGYASRTYVDAIVMRGDNRKGLQMLGFYDDQYRRTDDGWRISRRVFVPTITVRIEQWQPQT